MFSGIVESAAIVTRLEKDKDNLHITLKCEFTNELKIDQSGAHNGVCLTVVNIEGEEFTVTEIKETLDKSNLGLLNIGSKVNIERSMKIDGRLDGHIVQGHVDQTAVCQSVVENNGSWYYTFRYEIDEMQKRKGYTTVEKGSVTVNGVSLTVCDSKDNEFSVAIIPYTYEHTNFHKIEKGTVVNLEFDIIGKYLCKLMNIA
ncbi:MAG: riboflavin synthase [Paludibacteraceae bacterium]|nr:riboflavin synthase [Paludibacteraceae bacterium]